MPLVQDPRGATLPTGPARNASSNEAQSAESAPTLQFEFPAPLADQPDRWCVDGQYQIYRDAIEDVQPLGENLVDMVEQAKGADHATSEPTNTVLVESSRALEG